MAEEKKNPLDIFVEVCADFNAAINNLTYMDIRALEEMRIEGSEEDFSAREVLIFLGQMHDFTERIEKHVNNYIGPIKINGVKINWVPIDKQIETGHTIKAIKLLRDQVPIVLNAAKEVIEKRRGDKDDG